MSIYQFVPKKDLTALQNMMMFLSDNEESLELKDGRKGLFIDIEKLSEVFFELYDLEKIHLITAHDAGKRDNQLSTDYYRNTFESYKESNNY